MKKITKKEALKIVKKSEFILCDETKDNINLIIKKPKKWVSRCYPLQPFYPNHIHIFNTF